jgi:bacterioferritin-associated ferredoxin
MIVCLCHRISDRDIRRAVEVDGIRDFDTLQDETMLARNCGCCHDCAKDIFDAACSAAPNRRAPIRIHVVEQAAA